MTIKATEVNKIFRYATFFDLSASNALELKFTDPGGIITIITNPRVTAPRHTSNRPRFRRIGRKQLHAIQYSSHRLPYSRNLDCMRYLHRHNPQRVFRQ